MSKRLLFWLVLMGVTLVAVTIFSFDPLRDLVSEPDRPDRPAPAPEPAPLDPASAPEAPSTSATRGVAGTVLDPEGAPQADAVVRLKLDKYVGWPGPERLQELLRDLSGDPLVDAGERIHAERMGVETNTDAEGRFSFDPVTDGPFDLSARYSGYADAGFGGVAKGTKDVLLRFRKGVGLEGTVVSTDGSPIEAAVVKCGDREVLTDAAGAFTVEDLPAGSTVKLMAAASGFSRSRMDQAVASSGTTTIESPIVLKPIAGFGGRVFDPEGEPLYRVEVYALLGRGTTGTAFSDRGGRYWFGDSHLGARPQCTFSLRFKHASYLDLVYEEFTVSKGERKLLPDVRMKRGASIEGKVTDAEGQPVFRVMLHVWPRLPGVDGRMPVKYAMTEGDGSYLVEGLQAGTYDLTVVAPGFTAAVIEAVEVTGSGITRASVELSRGLSVAGRVLGVDGEPVAGAKVTHMNRPDTRDGFEKPKSGAGTWASSATSDAGGRFEIHGFAEDQRVDVKVEAEGYSTSWAKQVTAGTEDLEVRLAGPGSVAGVLLDDATGDPIGIGKVYLHPPGASAPEATADGNGRFEMEGVAPGVHGLRGSAGGYLDGVLEGVVVKPGERTEGVEVRLTLGETLSGVVRSEDGAPVVGAHVGLHGSQTEFEDTGQDGEFEFKGLPPGRYRLTVGAEGFMQFSLDGVSVRDSQPLEVTLDRGGIVRGTAFGDDGRPLANARVALLGEGMTTRPPRATVKEDGTFEIEGVRPGPYDLVVAIREGDSIVGTRSVKVTVRQGEVTEVSVGGRSGPPRATLKGRLLYRGAPLTGSEVAILRVDPGVSMADLMRSVRTMRTDPSGRFVAQDLAPGSYRVMISDRGDPFDGPMVDLRIEGPGELERDIEIPDKELSGTVSVAGTGRPLSRAEVLAVRSDRLLLPVVSFSDLFLMMQGRTRTVERGGFRFDQLPEGETTLIVTARGFAPVILDGLRPGKSPPPLGVEMSAGHGVKVTVTDSAGSPIAGAAVLHLDARGRRFLSLKRLGALTNQTGEVEIRATPGTHRIAVQKQGYAPKESEVRVTGDRELAVTLEAGAKVQLSVTGPKGPVEGAVVLVYLPDGSRHAMQITQDSFRSGAMGRVTDEDGRLTIGELAGGALRFVATAPEGKTAEVVVQVPAGGEASAALRIR